MSPKDAFGVAVRAVGLLLCAGGLMYFGSGILLLLAPETPHRVAPGATIAYAMVCEAIGLGLMRCAEAVARFSYPDSQDNR